MNFVSVFFILQSENFTKVFQSCDILFFRLTVSLKN